MAETLKLYVPAGGWLVRSLTSYCQLHRVGNAEITGIGSITNIWVAINPNGTLQIKNFIAGPSYEMTSLVGNVTLRQGMPQFDTSQLPSGNYPQIDNSVVTWNCYAHLHVTFANPDMTISGGHLLDTQVSIGAEIVVRPMGCTACAPGILAGQIPADCVADAEVSVPPYGVFSNWDGRFWYEASVAESAATAKP